MDISTLDDQKQSISDDQELAKALAGVTEETTNLQSADDVTPPASITPLGASPDPVTADPNPSVVMPDPIMAQDIVSPSSAPTSVDPALDSIKQSALAELRPLVDKLEVEPEEKFNTYLLLIRSTDDKSLIAPAHEAAKSIPDETKKAQALLDIIKEIDFLSNPQQ